MLGCPARYLLSAATAYRHSLPGGHAALAAPREAKRQRQTNPIDCFGCNPTQPRPVRPSIPLPAPGLLLLLLLSHRLFPDLPSSPSSSSSTPSPTVEVSDSSLPRTRARPAEQASRSHRPLVAGPLLTLASKGRATRPSAAGPALRPHPTTHSTGPTHVYSPVLTVLYSIVPRPVPGAFHCRLYHPSVQLTSHNGWRRDHQARLPCAQGEARGSVNPAPFPPPPTPCAWANELYQ